MYSGNDSRLKALSISFCPSDYELLINAYQHCLEFKATAMD